MNTVIRTLATRRARNIALPLLLAVACSACVAYPAYNTGYGYGYSSYGYDTGYAAAPVWGWGPAFGAAYWSGPNYVVSPPSVIVRDRGYGYGYRGDSRAWHQGAGTHAWAGGNGWRNHRSAQPGHSRWNNGHARGTATPPGQHTRPARGNWRQR